MTGEYPKLMQTIDFMKAKIVQLELENAKLRDRIAELEGTVDEYSIVDAEIVEEDLCRVCANPITWDGYHNIWVHDKETILDHRAQR